MDSLRRRLDAHRAGHGIKKLWLAYKQASSAPPSPPSACTTDQPGGGGGDGFRVLVAFIDSVYAGEGAAGLVSEGLNAEWGEIMALLLDVAGQRKLPTQQDQEVMSPAAFRTMRFKALSLAEGCMKDEKLREEVKRQWPQVSWRVLELLHEVETEKEKVLVLKILERVGTASELYGVREGFGPMVQLLQSCEERELALQVLSTLNHFLGGLLAQQQQQDPVLDGSWQQVGDGTPRNQSSAPNSRANSLARAINSVSRLGPWLSSLVVDASSWSRQQSWRSGDGSKAGHMRGSSSSQHPKSFVLSKLEIEEAEQLVADLERERVSSSWPRASCSQGSITTTATTIATSEAVSEPLEEKIGARGASISSGRWEEGCGAPAQAVIRDVMVCKGMLEGLVRWMRRAEVLSEAIDLLQTVQILLRRHIPAQVEFASLGGYEEIGRMLDRLIEHYVPAADVDAFIKEALLVLMGMALDGPLSYGAKVRNCSALRGLFSLVTSSSDLDVSLQAVQCLLDLLALHPLNIVYFEHVRGVPALFHVLACALLPFYSQEGGATKAAAHPFSVWQILDSLEATMSTDGNDEAVRPTQSFAAKTADLPTDPPPVAQRSRWKAEHHFRLFGSVTGLLQQMSIISSDRDARFLNMYACLIRHYVAIRNATTRATTSTSTTTSVGAASLTVPKQQTATSSECPPSCSHCQLDAPAMRCLHARCMTECKAFLCRECDHVLHKAPDKRSHIRVSLLEPLVPGAPAASLPPISAPCITLPSLDPEPWLSRIINHLLTCLRDLLDDRRARNQPLDCLLIDGLMDAFQESVESSLTTGTPSTVALGESSSPPPSSPMQPNDEADVLDRSSKGKEGKSSEERGGVSVAAATAGTASVEPHYLLLMMEVLARTLLVGAKEEGKILERWSERGGWALLALLVTEAAVPPETTEVADELIRRFAVWLLREALLSWIIVHPDDASHLSWLIHVFRRVFEGSTASSSLGVGGGMATSGKDDGVGNQGGKRRFPAWLLEVVVQEMRVLLAQVVDRSQIATIDELSAALGPPNPGARPASWRSLSQENNAFVAEPRAHVLSVERVASGPNRPHHLAAESVVLGRCAQSYSLLVKKEMVALGAVELVVTLVHHHIAVCELLGRRPQTGPGGSDRPSDKHALEEAAHPSTSTSAPPPQLLASVGLLIELIAGCLEAKTRLGALVGYQNIPLFLPDSLPPMLRFNLLIEASITDRIIPCTPPFTTVHLSCATPVVDKPRDPEARAASSSSSSTSSPVRQQVAESDSEGAQPLSGGSAPLSDTAHGSSGSSPWAVMPVYYMPSALAPIFYGVFFPQTHLSTWPACSSLLNLTVNQHDDVSTTSAQRVSPASSLSSSRPTSSCHYDKQDLSSLSRSNLGGGGASSVASANSLLHLNFRVKLEETNNPHLCMGPCDEDGLLPPEDEEPIDPSQQLEVDLFNLHLAHFIDSDAALLPFLTLPSLDATDQPMALRVISRLLDSNPTNSRILREECSSRAVGTLQLILRLACSARDAVQPLFLQLVAQFCCYTITVPEVRLLFNLAAGASTTWSTFLSTQHQHDESAAAGTSITNTTGSQSMTRRELQMQLLYVIGRVVEYHAPPSFFHLDGTYGGLRLFVKDRLSTSKGGYTIATWVRPSAFPHESSVALLSVVGQQQSSYIEVQFSTKRRRKSPSDTLPAYLRLVLRISDDHDEGTGGGAATDLFRGFGGGGGTCATGGSILPGSATFHVITLQDFEWKEGGAWHQVVITHQPGGIQVSIDGRGIGGYEATDDGLLQRLYTCVTKDRDLSINVGLPAAICRRRPMPDGTEETRSTFLCGQVGPVTIFEGVWDETQMRMAAGRFQLDDPPPGLPSFGKRILTADPTALSGSTDGNATVATGTASVSSAASTSATAVRSPSDNYSIFSRLAGSKEEGAGAPYTQVAGSRVQIHTTHSMTVTIREMGALRLCLPFFLMGPEQQVAALRLLGGITRSSPDDARALMEANTLGVLLHVLTASLSFLSMEVFDVIFDLITSVSSSITGATTTGITTTFTGNPLRMVAHPPGLTLVVDLLCYCGHDIGLQLKVIEGLIDLLDDNIHNLRAWHRELGAVACLRLLHLHTQLSSSMTDESDEAGERMVEDAAGEAIMLDQSAGAWARHHGSELACFGDSPACRLRELAIKLIKVAITSSSSIGHAITRSSSTVLVSGFSTDHLSLLLSFLVARSSSSEPSSALPSSLLLQLLVRLLQDPGGSALLSMLRHCMVAGGTTSSTTSANSNHWLVVLELLSSPISDVRVQAIQLTSLLLMRGHGAVDPKALSQFERLGGFAVMCESLGRYHPDMATCDALLSLILGRWSVLPDAAAGAKSAKETDFWPRNWSFFGSATEDHGPSVSCPSPSPDLATYYPGAAGTSSLAATEGPEESLPLSARSNEDGQVDGEAAGGNALSVLSAGDLRDSDGPMMTMMERAGSPSPRNSTTLLSKIFRRRSYDSTDELISPLGGLASLPPLSPSAALEHLPGSRRNSLSEAPSGILLLDDGGTAGAGPMQMGGGGNRSRKGTRGEAGRRLSGGSEGGTDYQGGGVYHHHQHPLAMVLPQAVEVLLFVLRKVSSASVLIRSMEGLEACLSPEYCTPQQQHHQQNQGAGVGRRSRVVSDGGASVDDDVLTPPGLAEANMEALMAQKQWLTWFHGLANTLYVRSVEEGAAFPFTTDGLEERTVGMETSLASISDTEDSFIGSEDGMDAYTERSDCLAESLHSFLEPVHSVVLRIVMYDLRLAYRSSSRHFLDLFKLAEGQMFQSAIVSGVLDTLQRSPVLSSEHASNVLKNLSSLLEMSDEHLDLPLDLCVKGVHVINLLGYKNGTAVRSKMKDVRLLDIRNTLTQNCLTMREVELPDRVAALARIESGLETLASSSSSSSGPLVNESHLVLLFLRFFMDLAITTPQHHQLHAAVLRLLSSVVLANPVDCRRCLIRTAGEVAPELLASLGCPLNREEEAQIRTDTATTASGGPNGAAPTLQGASTAGANAVNGGSSGNRWSLVSGLSRVSAPISVPGPSSATTSEATTGRLLSIFGTSAGSYTSRSTSPADAALLSCPPEAATLVMRMNEMMLAEHAQSGSLGPRADSGAPSPRATSPAIQDSEVSDPSRQAAPMKDSDTSVATMTDMRPSLLGTRSNSSSTVSSKIMHDGGVEGKVNWTIDVFIAWFGEDTEERAVSRRGLDDRIRKELTGYSKASEKYWERKSGKLLKLQLQCLERNLKHSLLRQKVLMETTERCRAFAEKCSDKVGLALTAWNDSQRLRLSVGKQVFLQVQQQQWTGGGGASDGGQQEGEMCLRSPRGGQGKQALAAIATRAATPV